MTPAAFRAAVKAAALTQRRLAALLGVHVSTVNRWCDEDRTDRLDVPLYAVNFVRAWTMLTEEQRATFVNPPRSG